LTQQTGGNKVRAARFRDKTRMAPRWTHPLPGKQAELLQLSCSLPLSWRSLAHKLDSGLYLDFGLAEGSGHSGALRSTWPPKQTLAAQMALPRLTTPDYLHKTPP